MLIGAYFGIFGRRSDGFLGRGHLHRSGSWCACSALIHAFVSITLRADQVVSGTGDRLPGGRRHRLHLHLPLRRHRARPLELSTRAGREAAGDRGPRLLRRRRSGTLGLLTWVGLVLVPMTDAVPVPDPRRLAPPLGGEKPRAADTLGLPVIRTRYLAVVASGALAAHGGAYLSIALARLLQREHDRRSRLHRARGGDLRSLAAVGRARRRAPVRLLDRARAAAAGVLASPRRCCSRRCHMS